MKTKIYYTRQGEIPDMYMPDSEWWDAKGPYIYSPSLDDLERIRKEVTPGCEDWIKEMTVPVDMNGVFWSYEEPEEFKKSIVRIHQERSRQ